MRGPRPGRSSIRARSSEATQRFAHRRQPRESRRQTVYSTQEDPIGLAGGSNLYGYANADPVNATDPFGLCPKSAGGDGKTEGTDDCPRGSSGWWAWRDANNEGSTAYNHVRGWIASVDEALTPELPPGVMMGVPPLVGGPGGFNNLRTLNRLRITRYTISVDAEIGGSGLAQVHVHLHGLEKVLLNGIEDLKKLPRAVRENPAVIRAVDKAFRWITKQGIQ